jgi:DNA primase
MSQFKQVLEKFNIQRQSGDTYQAICPAHEDHSPSLSIRIEDERVLLHCFAGCSTDAVLASVGLSFDDLFIKTERQYNVNAPQLLSTHHYYDEQNKLKYSVEKYLKDNKKQFRFYQFEDNKKIYNLKNVKKVLYRLPELIEGMEKTEFVCICEGEKDVDNLMNLGLLATTNPTGAEGWKSEYNNYFLNSNVVIFEDNDEAGRKRTKKLISELSYIAKSIKVIDFPDLPEHSDISDWFEQGGTKEMLL